MLAAFLAAFSILTVPITVKVISLCSKEKQLSKFDGCQDPPCERPYDYFGVVNIIAATRHLLNKTALANTVDRFHTYGETYVTRFLDQRIFLTCDPRNIKHVLVSRFIDYDSSTVRVHLFLPITEHGIFAVDGPEWKRARNVYRNVFSRTRSIIDLNVQERQFQRFLHLIPPTGEPFDLQALFLKLTLDLTTAFALGESVDSLSPSQSDEKKQMVQSLLYAKKKIARDGFLGPLRLLFGRRDFYRACSDVHRYVERRIEGVIQEKRQQGEDGGLEKHLKGFNLLQALADNTDNVLELRDGVISIMIAGIDSVASLLSATFWLLARDERVFAKLRASVLDSFGQELPNYDQLKGLTYLRHVFQEAMRVYPPVPFNARIANKDSTLLYGGGGDGNSSVLVKKGDKVIFSSWASHRSLKTFGEDSHEFRPERWERLTAEELMGYIPFNSGPRACPGQQYAMMEASYAAVRILQNFSEVKNRDPRGWTEHIALSLSNGNGVLVELVRKSEVQNVT